MNHFASITYAKITFLFLLTFYYNSIQAAPVIDSVSGIIQHGSQVVISGSNFNSNNSPTPLIWDDFESGTTNSALNPNPRIGSWLLSNRPDPVYSTTQSVSGNKSAYMAYSYPDRQWSSFVVNPLPISDRFYQSFYFWFSSYGQGQIKVMQVHGDSGIGDFAPGFMFGTSGYKWWNSYISIVGRDSGYGSGTQESIPENEVPLEGKWHHFEMFLQRSSAGNVADGSVVVKLDGVTRYNQQNTVTRTNSAYNWNEISFMHGITNALEDIDAYIDDAYLNNTWARVELCETPLYSDCQTKVIQPASAWQNNQINVTLVKGPFDNINPLYLYVVDANNVVNSNGYPFCTTCPKAPADNVAK